MLLPNPTAKWRKKKNCFFGLFLLLKIKHRSETFTETVGVFSASSKLCSSSGNSTATVADEELFFSVFFS